MKKHYFKRISCLLKTGLVLSLLAVATDIRAEEDHSTIEEKSPATENREILIPESPYKGTKQSHPFLLINQKEIDFIKGKIESDPRYQEFYQKGVLKDARNAWAHLSKTIGNIPRERNGEAHSKICIATQQLAVAYVLNEESRYAEMVKKVLLEYSEFYSTVPIKRPWADGYLTAQTLSESLILINLIWAYDLTYSIYTPEERTKIEERLFREAVTMVNRRDRGESNWQAWHNAATAAIGVVIGDPEIWKPTLQGPRGFMYHVERSILEDGLWYEQSIAYHYFTIHALTLLAEIGYRQGYDLYSAKVGERTIRLLYDGPFYHAMSNLAQPPFGDSQTNYTLVAPWVAWNYAFAYKYYKDPKYLWLWNLNDIIHKRPQGTRIPPLFCLPYIEDADQDPYEFYIESGKPIPGVTNVGGNSLLNVVGMAVMRGSSDEPSPESAVIWKPNGSVAGHQHPNNLGIYWQTPHHRWISSSGKWASYSSDIHLGWVKQTLSDNTLVVDRKSQYPAFDGAPSWEKDEPGNPSSGELRSFLANRKFVLAEVQTERVYKGVTINRRLYNTSDYSLDVVSAHSKEEHLYDYALHITGELVQSNVTLTPREEPLADGGGYPFLKELKEATLQRRWETEWKAPRVKEQLRMTVLSAEGRKGIVANGPWAIPEGRSIMLVSNESRDTQFITLIRAVDGEDPIHRVRNVGLKEGGSGVEVVHQGGTDYFVWDDAVRELTLDNGKFQGRNILLRANFEGTIQTGLFSSSSYAIFNETRIALETPASWAVEWLDKEAFVLTYLEEASNRLMIPEGAEWKVYLLDAGAHSVKEIEWQLDGGSLPWITIDSQREYLFKKREAEKEYPVHPMKKTFHYNP